MHPGGVLTKGKTPVRKKPSGRSKLRDNLPELFTNAKVKNSSHEKLGKLFQVRD